MCQQISVHRNSDFVSVSVHRNRDFVREKLYGVGGEVCRCELCVGVSCVWVE